MTGVYGKGMKWLAFTPVAVDRRLVVVSNNEHCFKGAPSIPETYLLSSVAWGLNLRVGWWRQILKNVSSVTGVRVQPPLCTVSLCRATYSFYFRLLLQAACNDDGASNTRTSRSKWHLPALIVNDVVATESHFCELILGRYGLWCSSYCRPGSLTCPGAVLGLGRWGYVAVRAWSTGQPAGRFGRRTSFEITRAGLTSVDLSAGRGFKNRPY